MTLKKSGHLLFYYPPPITAKQVGTWRASGVSLEISLASGRQYNCRPNSRRSEIASYVQLTVAG
jgi:hypothetical protein